MNDAELRRRAWLAATPLLTASALLTLTALGLGTEIVIRWGFSLPEAAILSVLIGYYRVGVEYGLESSRALVAGTLGTALLGIETAIAARLSRRRHAS